MKPEVVLAFDTEAPQSDVNRLHHGSVLRRGHESRKVVHASDQRLNV